MCHITVCIVVTQSHQSGHLGRKGLDVLLAACICSGHTQNEPWEAGSSGLFPRQLILSKVNVCKKRSFNLVAPDSADFLIHNSSQWLGLERMSRKTWQKSRFLWCMDVFEALLTARFIRTSGSTYICQLLTLYTRAHTVVDVLQKTV